jgi:hypothetical protein
MEAPSPAPVLVETAVPAYADYPSVVHAEPVDEDIMRLALAALETTREKLDTSAKKLEECEEEKEELHAAYAMQQQEMERKTSGAVEPEPEPPPAYSDVLNRIVDERDLEAGERARTDRLLAMRASASPRGWIKITHPQGADVFPGRQSSGGQGENINDAKEATINRGHGAFVICKECPGEYVMKHPPPQQCLDNLSVSERAPSPHCTQLDSSCTVYIAPGLVLTDDNKKLIAQKKKEGFKFSYVFFSGDEDRSPWTDETIEVARPREILAWLEENSSGSFLERHGLKVGQDGQTRTEVWAKRARLKKAYRELSAAKRVKADLAVRSSHGRSSRRRGGGGTRPVPPHRRGGQHISEQVVRHPPKRKYKKSKKKKYKKSRKKYKGKKSKRRKTYKRGGSGRSGGSRTRSTNNDERRREILQCATDAQIDAICTRTASGMTLRAPTFRPAARRYAAAGRPSRPSPPSPRPSPPSPSRPSPPSPPPILLPPSIPFVPPRHRLSCDISDNPDNPGQNRRTALHMLRNPTPQERSALNLEMDPGPHAEI